MTRHCDVAIVGGGPAGSACAWALRRAGADVIVVDGATFPRQKVCAGWITPRLFDVLALDPEEYRRAGLVLQQVRGFRTGIVGDRRAVRYWYSEVVSYVIRRIEFDHYLLRRSGAQVLDNTRVKSVRRLDDGWMINEGIVARALVGAAGHFCPVARLLNPLDREDAVTVVGRELEVRVPASDSRVEGLRPELYFCRDLDGYGWCVRKDDYVNVGFGRRTAEGFNDHVRGFAEWLGGLGRVPPSVLHWTSWKGHAYRIRQGARVVADTGVMLAGDAAAMAWPESGEGIVPAVESGLAAAQAAREAGAGLASASFSGYAAQMAASSTASGSPRVPAAIARQFLRVPAFARIALDRWFLRVAPGVRSANRPSGVPGLDLAPRSADSQT